MSEIPYVDPQNVAHLKTEPEKHGVLIPVRLNESDTTGTVGKMMAHIGKTVGDLVTNQFAQDGGNWDVDIRVTMTKVD